MSLNKITHNLYQLPLSGVNAYLITSPNELILIDTGSPGDEVKITAALTQLGRTPADISHIILTHCHPDHAGSLAALQTQTVATTLMHPLDANLVRQGRALRPLTPAPGLLNRLLYRFIIAPIPDTFTPARIDQTVTDGETLPLAGGLRIIHAPGHSAGQIALLWESESVFFAADTVLNQPSLRHHIAYEDVALGKQTAAKLAKLTFDIATFGHGHPILKNAHTRFKRKFMPPSVSNHL